MKKDDEIIEVLDFNSTKPKKNTKKKINRWYVTFIIFDALACICLFVAYGPWAWFRNFLITTAVTTNSHIYLAQTFYSDTLIEKVKNENATISVNEDTNTSEIIFANTEDTGIYESKYEEQILKRDEGNDLYKVFPVKVNSSTAYIAVVYDPSRISLEMSKKINSGGQHLIDIAKDQNALLAVNASGFSRSGKKLIMHGTVIKDGKIISEVKNTIPDRGLIGFTYDNVLLLTQKSGAEAIEMGMKDAMTFGPFLYVNGVAAKTTGNSGGYAPRTVIAQRKDGIVFFIVFDGRGKGLGANMKDLIEILTRYKAYNAANLDGGGSSTLVIENKVVNYTGGFGYTGDRYLPNGWIIK